MRCEVENRRFIYLHGALTHGHQEILRDGLTLALVSS